MSPTTAPIFSEGPVTPDTLAALLREARAVLRDASRDGQLLGMRIDEALDQWDRGWNAPVVILLDESKVDRALFESRAAHMIVVGDGKPSAIPVLFAPPEDPE